MDSIDDFVTWQFGAACLFVQALVWLQRTVMAQAAPAASNRPWWKAVLTVSNIAWGLTAAVPSNFLMGETFSERAICGVGAGFISQFLYHLLLKRWIDRLSVSRAPGDDPPPPPPARDTSKDLPAQS